MTEEIVGILIVSFRCGGSGSFFILVWSRVSTFSFLDVTCSFEFKNFPGWVSLKLWNLSCHVKIFGSATDSVRYIEQKHFHVRPNRRSLEIEFRDFGAKVIKFFGVVLYFRKQEFYNPNWLNSSIHSIIPGQNFNFFRRKRLVSTLSRDNW